MKRMFTLLSALTLALCLCVPTLGAYTGVYVYDPDGILADADAEALAAQASELTDTYSCAVYLFTVADLTTYGYDDIFELAQDYYEENLLGCGEDRDGILLALSTETRDVSLAVYGPWAQTVFTDYGQEYLYDAFLTEFGNNDWYTGAVNYLSACQELLCEAQSGTPVDVPEERPGGIAPLPSHPAPAQVNPVRALLGGMAKALLPAVVIAFLVCGMMKRKMKTARKASGAAAYISSAVDLKVRTDHYTHSTVVRTPIKTDDGPKGGPRSGGGGSHRSGGTHVNSRGFSGSSRKF